MCYYNTSLHPSNHSCCGARHLRRLRKAFGIDSELHFNSQATFYGQSIQEMYRLLKLQGAENIDNLMLGAGDLYVTVYGGRTRLIGILLGRGCVLSRLNRSFPA